MDSSADDGPAQTLQRKILTYMLEHPEAKDTAGGILNWWLGGIVMLGWGLIPLAMGYFTTFRKDVT